MIWLIQKNISIIPNQTLVDLTKILFGFTKILDLFEKISLLDQVKHFLGVETFIKIFWLIQL